MADQSGWKCTESHLLGFEDPRVMVWNTTLLATTNALHPDDCHRGIVLFEFDETAVRANLRDQSLASHRIIPLQAHFLKPPKGWRGGGQAGWEKNWMPFVHNETLLFMRHIEPHEVVRCNLTGSDVCEVAASRSCPRLAQMLGTTLGLRCNTGVVDRGADFLAGGHTKNNTSLRYEFFWFTFSKTPPFEITGLSKLFRIIDPAPSV
jgi:hypothetical protein